MLDLTKFEADAPTPGQSLTTEPGGRPWETPPRQTEAFEVLGFYADKFLQPERAANLMEVLETGFPVTDLIDAITLGGVMQGEHSVDTGIIVAPHLYDIITDIADKFGVTYTTGLEEGETYGDDLSMAGVRKLSEQEDEALETLEQEKIEAYTAAAGLMSKPVDVTEEEEEE
jgi:hypothetical protein|tara:strand:- start:349 stop:864 length:516 start_codon:yes stop_codon:yes gene_type:complete